MIRIVDAKEQLTQGAILHNPKTKYKRLKNVLAVTSIALICAQICARLLQPLAQSLIRSPGTLRQTGFKRSVGDVGPLKTFGELNSNRVSFDINVSYSSC